MGPESTATQRLNFAQSFNPFGAISGVIISQIFILSQLNVFTAAERAALPAAELAAIQADELNAVTMTYVAVGAVMVVLLLAIWLTRMPNLREEDKTLQFGAAFRRLVRNRNYVWGVVAQFFYVGAQIAVWSFVIRYAMQQLHFDAVIAGLGSGASTEASSRPCGAWNPSLPDFTTSVPGSDWTTCCPGPPNRPARPTISFRWCCSSSPASFARG